VWKTTLSIVLTSRGTIVSAAATALNELTKEALSRIFREEWDALLGRAWRSLRRLDEAEEAVQETAVKAFQSLDSLRDPDRIAGWLFQTLGHECQDRLRRRKKEEELAAPPPPPDPAPYEEEEFEDPPDAVAEAAEFYWVDDLEEFVRRALESLPDDLRVIVERAGMGDERISALARDLGLDWMAADRKLHRAFHILRPRFARLMRGLQG
jgi:RNA polymerase sigma-70 factor, ECF subfamily